MGTHWAVPDLRELVRVVSLSWRWKARNARPGSDPRQASERFGTSRSECAQATEEPCRAAGSSMQRRGVERAVQRDTGLRFHLGPKLQKPVLPVVRNPADREPKV